MQIPTIDQLHWIFTIYRMIAILSKLSCLPIALNIQPLVHVFTYVGWIFSLPFTAQTNWNETIRKTNVLKCAPQGFPDTNTQQYTHTHTYIHLREHIRHISFFLHIILVRSSHGYMLCCRMYVLQYIIHDVYYTMLSTYVHETWTNTHLSAAMTTPTTTTTISPQYSS